MSSHINDKDGVLVDFATIEKNLSLVSSVHRGVHPIPLDSIVGSLGRYREFSEGFLPHGDRRSLKYRSVRQAMMDDKILPPIRVFKVLEHYFVIDGHNRVTVAKNELKAVDIDAEIIEIVFDVDLSVEKQYSYSTDQAAKFLIRLQEHAFVKMTGLKNSIVKHPLQVTELTSYGKLYDEIRSFRYTYDGGNLAKKDLIHAVYEWYEKQFFPAVELIARAELLKGFPKRTCTDLYVWIQQHKYYISQEAGYDVGFDFTMGDFINRFKKVNVLYVIPQMLGDIVKALKNNVSR